MALDHRPPELPPREFQQALPSLAAAPHTGPPLGRAAAHWLRARAQAARTPRAASAGKGCPLTRPQVCVNRQLRRVVTELE
eukprot:CAMPEP_0181170332 /NCGR_PEP_ID=MMETSP1096-20121128/1304_1 /TAXON_ID=156174 ORGANISM="Chrysochromulina ericina, Strain CCMP281" /NCGR_SAMPLE_ID=MMETSP1096 /ASSEMBLY_ACC=CAM_ASM_000453 /LENGTH=80 /DNA_ID=CAMNT_0023257875 /DNA_START=722 /DNA_END=960 /DNA_ORIENTATION=+